MDSPVPGALVASPLRIQGYARGNWFFEGDFPVVLKNTKDKTIVKRFATAKNGWMTETFVPFESMIEFKRPGSGSKGTLVLKKNNPTDRLEFDDKLEIPVFLNDIACITIKKKTHLIIELFWDLTI
ncbi:MAG: Gmad2 immunoglobulin-like domain-containing protein [Desulfobacterales bacterium]